MFIFLLVGTVAAVHNMWYSQWPLHDAVRGTVTSNNTEKLEKFLGKEKFVHTIMSIKRPDVRCLMIIRVACWRRCARERSFYIE